MNKIESLYKKQPVVSENATIGNAFTDMILQTKNVATATFDRLAYLAGIKSAPEDAKFQDLDKSNLAALLSSAKSAGYDIEVVSA
ncbi:XRE family transcriptional regulator [Burkholderia stabilis]|uniref:XRE family transcriptional regulator n=1 Tax=Burkholderia stabilis TaxID=95485 RepID=UPI00158AFA45|nr:XRE family transcriptional regulator [Burkholderia stabilis]